MADGLDGVEVAGSLEFVDPQFGGGVEGDAEDDGEGAGRLAGAGDASDQQVGVHEGDLDEVAARVEAVGQGLVHVGLAVLHERPQLPAGLRGVAAGDPQDEAAGVGGAVGLGPHGADGASHGGGEGGPLLQDGGGLDARGQVDLGAPAGAVAHDLGGELDTAAALLALDADRGERVEDLGGVEAAQDVGGDVAGDQRPVALLPGGADQGGRGDRGGEGPAGHQERADEGGDAGGGGDDDRGDAARADSAGVLAGQGQPRLDVGGRGGLGLDGAGLGVGDPLAPADDEPSGAARGAQQETAEVDGGAEGVEAGDVAVVGRCPADGVLEDVPASQGGGDDGRRVREVGLPLGDPGAAWAPARRAGRRGGARRPG